MDYISKMLGITPKIAICQCQVEGPTVCIQILETDVELITILMVTNRSCY